MVGVQFYLAWPAPAEGACDAEHKQLGDRYVFDEQESMIGTEDTQRTFGLTPPVEG
jgi:hypothetical protein